MTSSPLNGEDPGTTPARPPSSPARRTAQRSGQDAKRAPQPSPAVPAEPALLPVGVLAGARPQPIVPRSMGEALELARAVVAAGLAPRGLERAEACMIAILHGLEV